VLDATGRHDVLAECDTITIIVIVNGDGRPKALVKLMSQLLQNTSPPE
jgi:hypothetical protein